MLKIHDRAPLSSSQSFIIIWMLLRAGKVKKIPRRDWLQRDQDVVGGVLTVRKCPLPVRLASRVFYSLSRNIEMLVTGWHGVHI